MPVNTDKFSQTILRDPRLLIPFMAGLTCQIQFPIPVGPSVINFNLADFFVLPFGLVVLWQLLRFFQQGGQIGNRKSIWLFPSLVTFLMGSALLIAILDPQELSNWALFNRFIGWFILLGYYATAIWIALNTGRSGVYIFSLSIVIGAIIPSAFHFVAAKLNQFIKTDNWIEGIAVDFAPDQLSGLMSNPNAFAIPLCFGLAFSLIYFREAHSKKIAASQILVIFLLVTGVIATASRAAWIAAGFIILAYPFFRLPNWRDFAGLSLAVLMVLGNAMMHDEKSLLQDYDRSGLAAVIKAKEMLEFSPSDAQPTDEEIAALPELPGAKPSINSLQIRMIQLKEATEMWKESPLLGIGLGRYLENTKGVNGQKIVLHSTPLWILTETGLAGSVIFLGGLAGLYLIIFKQIRRASQIELGPKYREADFYKTIFLFLTAVGLISVFHDILYQRILWLLLGVVIGLMHLSRDHQAQMKE